MFLDTGAPSTAEIVAANFWGRLLEILEDEFTEGRTGGKCGRREIRAWDVSDVTDEESSASSESDQPSDPVVNVRDRSRGISSVDIMDAWLLDTFERPCTSCCRSLSERWDVKGSEKTR